MGSHSAPSLEDRLRLACDTQDAIIQRLFAIGMGLQSLVELVEDPVLTDRLTRYIAELDEAIVEARARVLELRKAANSPELLESGVSGTALAGDVVF